MSTLLSMRGVVVEHRAAGWWSRPTRAVDGASLDVAAGEVVAIVGASGCGKTSLLRAACGILPRAAGTVALLGVDPARLGRPPPRAQLLVQDASGALHPGLRVREALREAARVHQPANGEAVASALHAVGLDHRASAYPAELSGGERRRVTLACLWLADPLVTLLDEPTAGLDAPRRAEFLDLLMSRHDMSRATVMVTHDLVAALHACTRVVFMDQGHIVADHPARDVGAARHPAARRLLDTLGPVEPAC